MTGAVYTVALAGNPKVGKSTLFNALTGLNQHTGNWAGKTVEVARGRFTHRGAEYCIVDLPGMCSMKSDGAEEKLARDAAKGLTRPLRVMVVGITNVGKSTFINTYTKTKKAKAEDRPGVTREQRWIASPYGVELLDTPGLLWHKFDDPAVGIKLACTGAIRDEILDLYSLSHELLGMLAQSYPALLEARYGIKIAAGDSIGDVFEAIARRRGFLRAGGEIDEERTAAVLLDEFRGGRIGRITLD